MGLGLRVGVRVKVPRHQCERQPHGTRRAVGALQLDTHLVRVRVRGQIQGKS